LEISPDTYDYYILLLTFMNMINLVSLWILSCSLDFELISTFCLFFFWENTVWLQGHLFKLFSFRQSTSKLAKKKAVALIHGNLRFWGDYGHFAFCMKFTFNCIQTGQLNTPPLVASLYNKVYIFKLPDSNTKTEICPVWWGIMNSIELYVKAKQFIMLE
jgi:hypothetical protein